MKTKSLAAIVGVSVLLLAYVNCGRVGFDARRNLSGIHAASITGCEEILFSAYSETYFPILSVSCNRCHSDAHGSTDLMTSYNAFMDRSVELIDYQATHPHGDNGLNLTNEINAIKPDWNLAQDDYVTCLSEPSSTTTTTTTTTTTVPSSPSTTTSTLPGSTTTTTTMPSGPVTFTQLISSDPVLGVFRNSCFGCHAGATPAAGVNLSDYPSAKTNASRILLAVQNGYMPPGRGLPQSQIDIISQWVNGGTPP